MTKVKSYDAIVLGLGGMGSATLYELSRRGVKALGIDQFDIAHDRGSSHGQTRIIRKAYFEHPDYVPLLHRTYDLWADLEAVSKRKLIDWAGLLLAGPPNGAVITGVKQAAAKHNLAIEQVPASEWANRFPGFRINESDEILFEANAGLLHVEDCIKTFVSLAKQHGADIQINTPVIRWSAQKSSVSVETADQKISASTLFICGGSWASKLLQPLRLSLEVHRKVVLWCKTQDRAYRLDQGCPVFGIETDAGFFYEFPAFDDGLVKIGDHTGVTMASDMDQLNRTVVRDDWSRLDAFMKKHLPSIIPEPIETSVCTYTMTPDENFIVDLHPNYPHVAIAAGFSGHGYKFAPVVASAMADLIETGSTDLPIEFLPINREKLQSNMPPTSD